MAYWRSMEPAAEVWVPCELQMAADWTMEPAAQVWVPGLPVEYQTSVLASSEQQQLIAYAAATEKAAATQDQFDGVDHIIHHEVEVKIHDDPIHVFEKAALVFDSDIKKMGVKIHRYPKSLDSLLIKRYSVPSIVAIGPHHHREPDLQEAEKVKHVAAYHCIKDSGHSVQDMYDAVVSGADYARSLYDEDAVAGFSNDDFQPMMFYDACFLVQYMLTCTGDGLDEMDPSLLSFFDANDEAILNDIMMLENQLPWPVVETVMRFRPVPLDEVITALKRCLQDRKDLKGMQHVVLDESYKPPHFLSLLRFYIVGRRPRSDVDSKESDLPDSISFSVNAIELAEIGIKLTARETSELINIGIEKGRCPHKLSLPQLSLDDTNACILVNMAAFELCTIPDFHEADEEDSAVCSYLQLLAMIVDKTEDVQELRKERVLQGGGGLNNTQVLEILNCLQDLRSGSSYIRTMLQIEAYKQRCWLWVEVHAFVYKNMKTIYAVFGAVTALASILGTIISFKNG